jgi:hypothetical protein
MISARWELNKDIFFKKTPSLKKLITITLGEMTHLITEVFAKENIYLKGGHLS